ncbi:hypothetical protein GCM10007388_26060 [Pseudoduganella plicata]|nr:hypothetical protein GCM10007388_26060 [Pseudoduganella plicata]
MQQALTFPAPRRHALVAGLAISALLHALLLFYLRLPTSTRTEPDTRRWAQPLTVQLLPPPPPPVAPSAPKAEPKAVTPERAARPGRALPQSIVAAPRSDASATMDATPEPTPSAEPQVDIAAARATARGIAKELPSSDNWAAEKLAKARELEETRDEKLGKNIARSARPDCRNGAGGLLAPLIWLMDKKDSGCKF